ncbi:hypothetical protein KORDIASMS9_02840 [Kordia sp. SMS9]|uniref:hypothetical protein n=1 Tax=Kordia sp. SMS9 TaxID=2282170 RepID=UPI000E0CC3E7|nr:hypothetical protein [Kordia sp. SMS9]AXG70600.1 hypothetical protein KORDIASMS9_02840 [Kordia sp. SMS9]
MNRIKRGIQKLESKQIDLINKQIEDLNHKRSHRNRSFVLSCIVILGAFFSFLAITYPNFKTSQKTANVELGYEVLRLWTATDTVSNKELKKLIRTSLASEIDFAEMLANNDSLNQKIKKIDILVNSPVNMGWCINDEKGVLNFNNSNYSKEIYDKLKKKYGDILWAETMNLPEFEYFELDSLPANRHY